MNSDELRAIQASLEEQLVQLKKLTEPYCVAFQTLQHAHIIETTFSTQG